ncbi:cob(I)yrinic acid a,c-diamide adenosyltransferase [Metallumcola ferriviriculae]|uniref:Cob(I)yrinic acid a,c-diamide adenosyltransferase n=1 Tax=Metallumcola ferriviriculae TaxID=3039180 RepID=A0AAU0UQ01_9FIRM|nr:cob(I)yrinic acid a,c-diamide adenosyltransferase [Desulfitibacteraceae bacterium MK1]
MQKGLLMVYTGNGKGKTTAALGQAIRSLGHGKRVFMLQFMKGSPNYGEVIMSKKLTGFTMEQWGRDEFVHPKQPEQIDIDWAQRGLLRANEVIQSGEYQLIILDELNVALGFGLVFWEQVEELLNTKPKILDLIITGRYAPPALLKRADLVSVIDEHRHHYQSGVEAREGIEY